MTLIIGLLGYIGCENKSVSQWTTPQNIAPSLRGYAEVVTVVVDGAGEPHVAWAQYDEQYIGDEIYHTVRHNGAWSPPENVSSSPNPSFIPVLLNDWTGNLHLFWGEQIGIPPGPRPRPTDIYWRMLTSSGWTDAISLLHEDSSQGFAPPSAVSATDGRIFLTVMRPLSPYPPEVRLLSRTSGVWGNPRYLKREIVPSITRDSSGTLWIAYLMGVPDSITPDGNSVLTINSTDEGATWSDSIIVSRSGLLFAYTPQILTDALGWHHIIWLKLTHPNQGVPRSVFHTRSFDGIAWQTPVNVTEGNDAMYGSFGCVADRYGRVHLVVKGDTTLYYYVFSDNSWSPAQQVPLGGTYPLFVALAISPSQVLHLVWSGWDSVSTGVYYSQRDIALSAKSAPEGLPRSYSLRPSFPNPFNPSTEIVFELPEASSVSLRVFDVLGREVATLVQGVYEAGSHRVVFNAQSNASGVYFARFVAMDLQRLPKYLGVNKLLLVR